MIQSSDNALTIAYNPAASGLEIRSPLWQSLSIGPLRPGLAVNGERLHARGFRLEESQQERMRLAADFVSGPVCLRLEQAVEQAGGDCLRLASALVNTSEQAVTLRAVQLLAIEARQGGIARLSENPATVRIFKQGGYWAQVGSLFGQAARAGTDGETGKQGNVQHSSQICWAGYDLASRMALAVGFETAERWSGHIALKAAEGRHPEEWEIGFAGGDLRVEAGERLALEDVLLLAGPDPWRLLESYADRVAERHGVQALPESPVSWCSWYPFRLGVTEGRMLENARIAAERLKPLGLSIMEIDLGWERDYLPNAFEENGQFPHGLAWLADRLKEMGFLLGTWKAPFTISERDPLCGEHPEWLLGSEEQKPLPQGQWFWEPHGETFALDLTHPEARNWLRQSIRSLAARGVRYLKPDFIGCVGDGRMTDRFDRRIVAGGGTEAARLGLEIIRQEMTDGHPEALVLNCGGPELPGKGRFPLLYTCNDTGNTGYVGWPHLAEDYGQNVAGHLFKHRRWGILQPSCFCAGLPGTLEEARVRATATFMSGGQVDIGDNLSLLPEDRWQVIYATLPPLGIAARPVDLFDPIAASSLSYEAMCRGDNKDDLGMEAPVGSRVWHLPVDAGWDRWDLVALFNYDWPSPDSGGAGQLITRYQLPLERLGLDPEGVYWAYEFWSGQFLGQIPCAWQNPGGYVHPGDTQTLISTRTPGVLEAAFFGPSVKLLALKPVRPHPWVAGTTFHQSAGCELKNLSWNPQGLLKGELHRPAGHQGSIVLAGIARPPASAEVAGRSVPLRTGANGSLILPVTTLSDVTKWSVRWPM
ncbi:MAG: alpha-galactosidase [Armatimonadetes bacterium]|nr:alpha-galactosidase [Armatimonadota bacterium]